MKKIKLLLSILLTVLLTASLAAPTAAAHGQPLRGGDVSILTDGDLQPAIGGDTPIAVAGGTVLELSRSPFFPRYLSCGCGGVTVFGIPSATEYNYIWLLLLDEAGTERFSEIARRSHDGSVSFSIPKNLAGSYQLVLRHSDEYSSWYWDFVNGVRVSAADGNVFCCASSAYDRNIAFTERASWSDEALAFFLKPSEDIQSADAEIVKTAAAVTQGLSGDYNKAVALHDWVCDNIYYNYDALYQRTEFGDNSAVGALSTRRAVCEGYANLLAALLRANGIPARKVSGYALGITGGNEFPAEALNGTGKANHAWNEAFVDGRWIIIDAAWDSGNKYEFGQITENTGCYQHRYFDIGQDLFAVDHVVMTASNYTELNLYLDWPECYTREGWKSLGGGNVTPILRDGRTLVPILAVIEAMGGTVTYTPETEKYLARVTCKLNDSYAQMWVGSRRLLVDNKEYQFNIMPQLIDGCIMVAAKELFQAMGCSVIWNENADGWHGRVTVGYAS